MKKLALFALLSVSFGAPALGAPCTIPEDLRYEMAAEVSADINKELVEKFVGGETPANFSSHFRLQSGTEVFVRQVEPGSAGEKPTFGGWTCDGDRFTYFAIGEFASARNFVSELEEEN